VRAWLARAVRAPRDPVWEADGVVSEEWAPTSPVTGRLDAFEWREPPERLGQVIEPDLLEPPVLAAAERPAPAIEAKVAAIETPAKNGEAEPAKAAKAAPVDESAPASGPVDGKADEASPVDAEKADIEKSGTTSTDRRPRRSSTDREGEREVRIPPPPDDPGVKEAEEEDETAPGRFRLF
jgi:HemY protein